MTLGFTDPESPLACDLEGPISEIQKPLRAARRAAPVLKGVEGLI
jgi:maleamate amidohydrolase